MYSRRVVTHSKCQPIKRTTSQWYFTGGGGKKVHLFHFCLFLGQSATRTNSPSEPSLYKRTLKWVNKRLTQWLLGKTRCTETSLGVDRYSERKARSSHNTGTSDGWGEWPRCFCWHSHVGVHVDRTEKTSLSYMRHSWKTVRPWSDVGTWGLPCLEQGRLLQRTSPRTPGVFYQNILLWWRSVSWTPPVGLTR